MTAPHTNTGRLRESLEAFTKRTSKSGGNSIEIPVDLEWAHLTISLGIPPSELVALDQEAYVLHALQQGRTIGKSAMTEHINNMQRGL